MHQAVHAGDADGREEGADGGGDQAHQQRHQDDDRDGPPGELAEGFEDHHHGQEHDGEHGQQDGQGDLVGGLLAVGAFHQGDHAVQEGVAPLGGDTDNDAVGEDLGAPGHGRAVAAGLADDRRRLAGYGRLVDGGDALDDLAVGGDQVAGLADDQVAFGQRRGGYPLLGSVGAQAAGFGLGSHAAQCVGLGLAATFSHGLGEVGEDDGQEQPRRDRPGEQGGVRDGLDERDHGADQYHEHDGVPDLHPGVQFLERVDEGPTQNLPVEQAPGLGHPVSHRRGRRRQRSLQCPRVVRPSQAWSSEELSVRELLDDGTQRHGREEGQAADDQDHPDGQSDEHAVVGPEGAQRGWHHVLGRQHPA